MPSAMTRTFVEMDITGELLLELQEDDLSEDIGFAEDEEELKESLLSELTRLRKSSAKARRQDELHEQVDRAKKEVAAAAAAGAL